jgi:hypothetical protein
MTTRKSNAEKSVHFGTISMPIAKGLYTNGNYSLIMILAYLDSRKQKQEDGGYQYPYEYNAPDIHYNTGVGLKVVNNHLRMLKLRGALELIKDTNDRPIRTKMGALKYRVVKTVYEREWGPNSRRANVLNAGQSEPSAKNTSLLNGGHPEPSVTGAGTAQAGHSGPSVNAGQSEPGAESRAINAHREGHPEPSVGATVGLPGPSVKAPISGHSAPTNDNERIREEKICEKREDSSGSASALPPPKATAAAAATPALKTRAEDLKRSKGSKLIECQGRKVCQSRDLIVSVPTPSASLSSGRQLSASASDGSALPSGRLEESGVPSRGTAPSDRSKAKLDPIDAVYGIPVSYVRRYEKHVDALNRYLKDHEQVGERIAKGSDAEAGQVII